MTSRELVIRAIEFRRPERLPLKGYGELSDVVWVRHDPVMPPQAKGDPQLDQWFCRWSKTEVNNMGQVTGHPLNDLADMKDYSWPDGNDPRRYENVPGQMKEMSTDPNQRDKYTATSIFMLLWERMQALHGLANCMMDLMDDSAEINELADKIVEYDLAVIRNMHCVCGDRIQGFAFTEDWGTQTALQISPELWEKFFSPRYKRIFGAIHDCGWHVWMHSCGKINRIIPGLIEAGLNVINMQQPLTNGIEEIGRDFAGKICFQTSCDIQKTLPSGDHDLIAAEAKKLIFSWGTPDGGFILDDYGDQQAIGVKPETKEFMLRTYLELDPYKNGWNS